MKIIAVNIGKTVNNHKDIIESIERAWVLNKTRAMGCEYIIGVIKGIVYKDAYFVINQEKVKQDGEHPNRVKFELLEKCNDEQIAMINQYIINNNSNLGGFTTKYL
ncbi:hypothetical protein GWA97_08980 [Flavobacterium sp. LaA7.5]|nr:hypothetical protein [Flavobacterium salilacus subsp. altitudinum]